jgi:hypothetical protein
MIPDFRNEPATDFTDQNNYDLMQKAINQAKKRV